MPLQKFLEKTRFSLSNWNRQRKANSVDGAFSKWLRQSKINRRLGPETVATQKAFDAQTKLTLDDVKQTLEYLTPYESKIPLLRIGPDADGGYLVPDDLAGIKAMFSPGVSITTGFDNEIAEMGIDCYLADASVEQPSGLLPNMWFEKKFIGPENKEPFMTMDTWIEKSVGPEDDLMLQMDIEGAEYSVLQNLSEGTLSRFRILMIEFHCLHHVFLPEKHALYRSVFSKLRKTHTICHLHRNNASNAICINGLTIPPLVELTLIRNDRFTGTGERAKVPHPLDRPNVVIFPDLPSAKFWDA